MPNILENSYPVIFNTVRLVAWLEEINTMQKFFSIMCINAHTKFTKQMYRANKENNNNKEKKSTANGNYSCCNKINFNCLLWHLLFENSNPYSIPLLITISKESHHLDQYYLINFQYKITSRSCLFILWE